MLTFARCTVRWNFGNWIPDAVVINLGTNDYSTQPSPPSTRTCVLVISRLLLDSVEVFNEGYFQLVNTIRTGTIALLAKSM